MTNMVNIGNMLMSLKHKRRHGNKPVQEASEDLVEAVLMEQVSVRMEVVRIGTHRTGRNSRVAMPKVSLTFLSRCLDTELVVEVVQIPVFEGKTLMQN